MANQKLNLLILLCLTSTSDIIAQNEDQITTTQETLEPEAGTYEQNSNKKKHYIELSRHEIDKITKDCEVFFQKGINLDEMAKKAIEARKIDECLAILKYQEFTLAGAIKKTCKMWLQKYPDKNENKNLKTWIKKIQEKYPEEIYPVYVEIIELFFENREQKAFEKINKIISISYEKGKTENQELPEPKKLEQLEEALLLSDLVQFLLLFGEQIKAVTLNEIAITKFKLNDTQQTQETPLDILQYILTQQDEKLFGLIKKKQIDFQSFLSASDALLPLHAEEVLKEITSKISTIDSNPNEKTEFAKLFWRGNDIKEYEKIISPLIKASNQKASVWHNQVGKLNLGLPKDMNSNNLVRLVFPLGTGTGFFISNDGIIATAAHNFAINKANPFQVKILDLNKRNLNPIKIYIDPENDLALILVKERSESYFAICEEELKAGSIVYSIGFPLNSTQCYYQPLKVIASFPEASDILVTGDILRGMSGGPVLYSNQVVGVNSTSIGPTKAKYLLKSINKLKELKENESNVTAEELNKNELFQPKTILANYFSDMEVNSDTETESNMPLIYESSMTFEEFCKNINKNQTEKILSKTNTTISIISNIILNNQIVNYEAVKKLKAKNILPEYPDYLNAHKDKKTVGQELLKILEYNPQFSPALQELAFLSFLEGAGQLEDYQKRQELKEEQKVELYLTKIQNPKAFEKALEFMRRFWETDPNLRWKVFPDKYGSEKIIQSYFTLKKVAPILIAQAEGPLGDDKLIEFAQQGNTLAMAALAERLLSGNKSLKGYMFALQAADAGEPKGQSILAFYLLSGTAVEKNEKKGFEWAIKSAEAGDPRGSTIAGICLIQGLGTLPDKTKGMELIQKGIQGGDSTALQIAKNPGMEKRIQFITPQSSTNP